MYPLSMLSRRSTVSAPAYLHNNLVSSPQLFLCLWYSVRKSICRNGSESRAENLPQIQPMVLHRCQKGNIHIFNSLPTHTIGEMKIAIFNRTKTIKDVLYVRSLLTFILYHVIYKIEITVDQLAHATIKIILIDYNLFFHFLFTSKRNVFLCTNLVTTLERK